MKPQIHVDPEFSGLMPRLSAEEFDALRADVTVNGVQVKVVTDETGAILDGHHRYKIDRKSPTKVLAGAGKMSRAEKKAYITSTNSARRNLSPEQWQALRSAQKGIALELNQEGHTDKQIALKLGVSLPTVNRWIAEANISNSHSRNAYNAAAKGGKKKSETKPRRDNRRKVTESEAAEIYARSKAGETQEAIAAEHKITQPRVTQICRKAREAEEAQRERDRKAREAARAVKDLIKQGVHVGDFREVCTQIPDGAVDLIFTDPPYDRRSLPLYGDLAELAARVLRDGGSLICYLGQYQLPEVLDLVRPHLRFWWALAIRHTGTKARMREYGVVVHYKPLLWFIKGSRTTADKRVFVDDLIDSAREKDSHEWQQSLIEARYYIENLSRPKALVLDPFCGGGTTAVAAKGLGRRWLTCEIDPKQAAIAAQRVQGAGVHDAHV